MAEYVHVSELNDMHERKAYAKAEQRMFAARTPEEFLNALLKLMTTPRYKILHTLNAKEVEWRAVEDSVTENFRLHSDFLRKMRQHNQGNIVDWLMDTIPKKGIIVIKFEDGKLAFEFKQIVIQQGDVYKYGICLTASRCRILNLNKKKK